MAASTYNKGKERLLGTDIGAADVRVLILAGASVPAGAIDKDLDNVAAVLAVSGTTEAAVAGYTRKTLAITGPTENDGADSAAITWADVVYTTPAIGETWRGAIFYIEGASDAAREVLFYDEFTTGLPTNGQDITYQGGSLTVTDA